MTSHAVRSAGYLPESVSTLAAAGGVADVEVVDISPALRHSQTETGTRSEAGTASETGDNAAEASARLVADRLVGAVRRTGFAVVTGHGIEQHVFDAMSAVTEEFFALPMTEKSLVGFPAPEVIRGYEPLPASSEEVRSSNAMECFLINRLDTLADYPAGSAQARLWRWPNLWPERPAALRAVWESYYQQMERLGARLLELVAVALGLPQSWFADKFDRHFNNLAANHYPPRAALPGAGDPGAEAPMRNRPHTDHGALTLLYRPSEPGGLEVFAGGVWLQVPYLPGSLVINVGDMIDRWTGGALPATPHRVVGAAGATASQSRYSIVYFQQPNPDAVIEAAPGRTDDRRPIRAGAHITGKELGAPIVTALGL